MKLKKEKWNVYFNMELYEENERLVNYYLLKLICVYGD